MYHPSLLRSSQPIWLMNLLCNGWQDNTKDITAPNSWFPCHFPSIINHLIFSCYPSNETLYQHQTSSTLYSTSLIHPIQPLLISYILFRQTNDRCYMLHNFHSFITCECINNKPIDSSSSAIGDLTHFSIVCYTLYNSMDLDSISFSFIP